MDDVDSLNRFAVDMTTTILRMTITRLMLTITIRGMILMQIKTTTVGMAGIGEIMILEP